MSGLGGLIRRKTLIMFMHVLNSNHGIQKVAQSARIMLNEAEVTSSNSLSSSCADMSKKKKKSNHVQHMSLILMSGCYHTKQKPTLPFLN
jgi:23S rRNA maturation-related 3'-5' exoribonuclease YhaM